QGKGCTHLEKSVSLNSVKKGLKNCGFGQCTPCTNDKGGGGSSQRVSCADEVDGEVFEPVIWLCLQCGHQGCCRNSPAQHALKHFETPRSGTHALAVCLANWNVWCYKCDEAINPAESKKLAECMDWIKRQALQQRSAEKASGKKKSKDLDSDESHVRSSASPIRSPPRWTPQPRWIFARCQSYLLESPESKFSLWGEMGLNNLGNTCFFNAVMQNLTQTHVLRSLLHEKWSSGKQVDVPLDTHLSVATNQNGCGGKDIDKEALTPITITVTALHPLTSALIEFLDEMQKPTKSLTLNPRALFNQVCNKAARFKGYQQQDSHELLRYLLDGMKAEEIKRMQAGLQVTFDIKKAKIKNMDEATKKRIKEYGNHSKHTFVDTVFGGHLISSVKCNECHNISEILEPFLDLSLPILEAKGSKRNLSTSKSVDKPGSQVTEQQPPSEGDKLVNVAAAAQETETRTLSKHQQQKQKEKARKEARRKTRRSRTASQSEDADPALDPKKDSPVQSENEEEPREEGVGYRDPNDADSEASVLDRLSNAGSSRRCSEQAAPSIHNSLPEVTSDREKEEASCMGHVTTRPTDDDDQSDVKDKLNGADRLSLSSRASTSSNSSSRLSPVPSQHSSKASGAELSGATDEERRSSSKGGPKGDADGVEVKNVCVKVEQLSLNENGKEGPKVNGVIEEHLGKGVSGRKGSADSDGCKEAVVQENGMETKEDKDEKLHGGNEKNSDGPPTGIAPLAKIHELGDSLVDCNHVDSKKDKSTSVTPAKLNNSTSVSSKTSSSKTGSQGKTKPHPISTAAASRLNASTHSTTSPPVSPISPTSKTRVASTLAQRYQPKNQECSVMSCLNQFTAPELLTGSNKFGCETCSKMHKEEGKSSKTVYTDASKQLLIHQPPPILTLHLKRFQQVGYNLRKITRHIDFPMTLDVAPFCSSACKRYANSENRVLYGLYGVVEHSGRLQFGHYTAFVKVRQPNRKLNLYTLGIPRTLNLLNEQCERLQAEKSEERPQKEHGRSSAKNGDDGGDSSSGENSDRRSDSQNKSSNSANNISERNHIQSPVLPFHAGRNVSLPSGKWYHVSDTHVAEVSESKVLSAQAYILFYERLVS
ncbi:ubiquitin carboxyl-terminal hydrolase 16-like, partial [Diadema antillarum]|uniref:ubiquitin carboxyl-terminal hydrolase 16-like n=2 Tax=Diadema antillarum TaxID=105358 RepID=UPI003A8664AD